METRGQRRKRIEATVDAHPTFRRVSDYHAEKFNIDKSEMRKRFIDFLEAENFQYYDNSPHGVICFEYNPLNGRFVNRTLYSIDNLY